MHINAPSPDHSSIAIVMMSGMPLHKVARIALTALLGLVVPSVSSVGQMPQTAEPALRAPVWVYNNWSAYDELSDDVPLTEDLAMRELDEIIRLRKSGIAFDYYMMDAFWYDPDGGYRTWRAQSWPRGPDRWIAACQAHGIRPGLWFSTNTLTHMNPVAAWRDSLNADGTAMSLDTGGFLPDFMDVLDYWYDRGIRMFKFDMADFSAAAASEAKLKLPQEIRMNNAQAFHRALQRFRREHSDAVLVAFNGIVGDVSAPGATYNPLEAHWLDVFDAVYSGDPRPSDVPEMDFWRSVDIYSDQMVRHFEQGGIPLQCIDSTSFMLGDTHTNYRRRTGAWQGSLLLMVAHGGWVRTVHGNLELIDPDKARWLAKVRSIYDPLQQKGKTKSLGGSAAGSRPYGFGSFDTEGALYAIVNPAQTFNDVRLPRLAPTQAANTAGRILFRDAGYAPALDGDTVRLGPGQLALVGFGRYASSAYDLGVQDDIRIPRRIEPLRIKFHEADGSVEPASVETILVPPAEGDLRVIVQQRDHHGSIMRSTNHDNMKDFFKISVSQSGRRLPVEVRYDKVIWSGLSWAVGEVRHEHLKAQALLRIRVSSAETDPSARLDARVYEVEY